MKWPILISLFFFSCTNNVRNLSSIEVSEEQPATEQGEIWSNKEMEEAKLVRRQFKNMLLESTGDAKHMKRDAHPKHHGCVEAELKIDNAHLPSSYRVGLFERSSKMRSLIRFSNGDPNHLKSDKESDVRGMAIKVFNTNRTNYLTDIGVEDTHGIHDFVFMNSDVFFIKNPKHYGKFMTAVSRGTAGLALFGTLAFLNPFDRFVGVLRKAFSMKVGNPLDIDYHSATPYKLGNTSMKMKFKTCKNNKDELESQRGDNFLSEKLVNYLDKKGSCFDFYIQPNKNKRRNDIENAQVKWKESPFIKVGRLTIPKQSKQSVLARNDYCESTSFNPWRAPIENRPLGGVNRIRLEVYIKQAKMRQDFNGVTFPGPQEY